MRQHLKGLPYSQAKRQAAVECFTALNDGIDFCDLPPDVEKQAGELMAEFVRIANNINLGEHHHG